MDIVMITTAVRQDLLRQSLHSLVENSADISQHTVTVVFDRLVSISYDPNEPPLATTIINKVPMGASASRNIGAGSIPRYRRQEHVLFLDDDVYLCQNWDARLMELATFCSSSICSPYSHPFNHCEPMHYENGIDHGRPLVVSSVAMMMPWYIFDNVGPWDEPGGPGSSEDYAISMRAKDRGYGFAVTSPQCVLHCGLMSSGGTTIVGYKELCEQNDKLLDFWNIRGRVTFQ